MRHQKHGRKLGRKSAPRHALFSNLVTALLEFEHIETTDAKAKEIRRLTDRTISWPISLGELLTKDRAKMEVGERAKVVHAIRMAKRIVKNERVLGKLFDEIGPRYLGRAGGYTRVIKSRYRHGDGAPVSIIELTERPAKKSDKPAPQKSEAAPAPVAPTA